MPDEDALQTTLPHEQRRKREVGGVPAQDADDGDRAAKARGLERLLERPEPTADVLLRQGPIGTVNDIEPGYTLYAGSGPLATVRGMLPGATDFGKRFAGFIYAEGLKGAPDEVRLQSNVDDEFKAQKHQLAMYQYMRDNKQMLANNTLRSTIDKRVRPAP